MVDLEELVLTQFEEPTFTQLPDTDDPNQTQNSKEDCQGSIVLLEADIKRRYLQDPSSFPFSGIILCHGNEKHPLAFFKDDTSPFDILIGRNQKCDVVIPPAVADIRSGISGEAFRIQRNEEGGMMISSTNRYEIKIVGPGRIKTIDGWCRGEAVGKVPISAEDKIMLPQNTILFHRRTEHDTSMENKSTANIKVPAVPRNATVETIQQAIRSLNFVLDQYKASGNEDVITSLIPGVASSLTQVVPKQSDTVDLNPNPKKRMRNEEERGPKRANKDFQEKQKFLREKKKVRNALEIIKKPVKNKKLLDQARTTVKKAKGRNCYFHCKEGYCADGRFCYFNHPSKNRLENIGEIVDWFKYAPTPYGFIRSNQSKEKWYFQYANLNKDLPSKEIKLGLLVKVEKLLNESGRSRRAEGISPYMPK